MILGSLGMSMFWPATQADLNDKVPDGERPAALARYNCVWSAAVMGAAPLMGLLCDINMVLPYLLTAVIALAVWHVIRKFPVAVSSEKKAAEKLPVDNDREIRTMYFLRIAYLSNCIIWGARTALGTLIPAINEKMGRSSFDNGLCLMLFVFLLFGGFYRLSFHPNWKYKLSLLFSAQLLTLVSTVLAAVFLYNFYLMTFFLAVTALGASITYSSSQFYALDTRRNAGLRAGLHESLLNLGSIVVPLIVSYVAKTTQRMDLAFYCVALLIGVGLVAQFILAAVTAADRHHGLEQTSQPSVPPIRELLAAEKI
jgi:MFS family permease